MKKITQRLSIVLCLGTLFVFSLGFAQSFIDNDEQNIISSETADQTTPESNPNEQGPGDQKGKDGQTNTETQSNEDNQNTGSANRWDYSEKTATQRKREAVQQDFDGVIPSPGTVYYDREGNEIGDIGEKFKNGTIELVDLVPTTIGFIDLAVRIAPNLAVIMLIYAGVRYVLSTISDDKENAKNAVKHALIGLAEDIK